MTEPTVPTPFGGMSVNPSPRADPRVERVGFLPEPHRLTVLAAGGITSAHGQVVTHRYLERFPAHLPREKDPYYPLFVAYHKRTKATAKCWIGERVGIDECQGGLELHHAILEFSTINGVDLRAIQVDHPELTDMDAVARWAESDQNFRWICVFHHRGAAGAHTASHSDWEASQFVPGFLGPA